MTQAELLRYLVEALEGLGIEYMVAGSHAAMYYGEPRLTRDVDVVATLRPERLPALLQRFPPDEFYVDPEAAREAVETSGQFNIVHPASGLKIDVYVSPDTPYDRTRLARRQRLPLLPGVDAYFARPEDVILYKLLYPRQGGELHLRDVLGIIRVSGPELDERYVVEWADRLGTGGRLGAGSPAGRMRGRWAHSRDLGQSGRYLRLRVETFASCPRSSLAGWADRLASSMAASVEGAVPLS